MKNFAVIGAGPSGLACSRVLAEAGNKVIIFDQRNHLAGNCYDERDEHNILLHKYGPHYFRTNSLKLLEWLSQFTTWIPGQYYVRSKVEHQLIPMPVSLATMTMLKGEFFNEMKFKNYLKNERVLIENPQNAEEFCLSSVGRELYELLFKGYTKKQWGLDPKELDASITSRIPIRFDWNQKYVNEEFQVTPRDGHTQMYQKMVDHPHIKLNLQTHLKSKTILDMRKNFDGIIYTGPLDEFFNYQFGKLQYRSLEFKFQHYDQDYVQPCVQINYPNDYDYTRSVEIKHVTGQIIAGTTVCFEYPKSSGEPFYPLLTSENKTRFQKYFLLTKEEKNQKHPIYFLGRLAEFRYYNMDHVLLNSIKLAENILNNWNHRD